ncbi:MAG: hypothetical protein PF485_03745 [Bacteroidales bacterium]|jgi:hypothetical protein|nr:hypothetical protein [Bacteroidales bacterium]
MKKGKIGYFIIGSAIIWGLVIVGCSLKLKGTTCYENINLILSGGAGIHLLLIWGPLVSFFKKETNTEKTDSLV